MIQNKAKKIHTVKTWDASFTSIKIHILTKIIFQIKLFHFDKILIIFGSVKNLQPQHTVCWKDVFTENDPLQ